MEDFSSLEFQNLAQHYTALLVFSGLFVEGVCISKALTLCTTLLIIMISHCRDQVIQQGRCYKTVLNSFSKALIRLEVCALALWHYAYNRTMNQGRGLSDSLVHKL